MDQPDVAPGTEAPPRHEPSTEAPPRHEPAAETLHQHDPAAETLPWHEPGAAFVAPVPSDPSLAAVPPPGSLDGAPLAWSRAARYGADDPAW
jgi:hypothetical protein